MKPDIEDIFNQYLKKELTFDNAKSKIQKILIKTGIEMELEHVLKYQDNNSMDIALSIIDWFEDSEDYLPLLHRLLVEKWHYRHEMVLNSIRYYKSPSSIEFIAKAVNLSEIDYLVNHDTDYASFIRKCMWAIADIKTDESIDLLKSYLGDVNPVISQYADEQLRWLNGEKGMRYMD